MVGLGCDTLMEREMNEAVNKFSLMVISSRTTEISRRGLPFPVCIIFT